MRYSIVHTTNYKYQEKVNLCHNIVILSPRNSNSQICHSFNIAISPVPEIFDEYEDFFGNRNCYFEIEQEHESLTVTATSIVEKIYSQYNQNNYSWQSWESVRDAINGSKGKMADIKQFSCVTEITATNRSVLQYAEQSFTNNRPLYEAVRDLMQRIYHDFKYTTGFTTISTPLSLVMEERKGVCQDFAHLAIACLRAMQLPARYVSGYIETSQADEKEKLAGADASHAWFSVYIPEMGWVDFDPTNNHLPGEHHICIGWGRDYFDIAPLRGVILSGRPHDLSVLVDVRRI